MVKKAPAAKKSSTSDKRKALSDLLASESPPPAMLFLAPDTVRRERMKKVYLEKFASGDRVDQRVNLADLNERKLKELEEGFRSLSLFSNSRIYFLENVDEADASTLADVAKLLGELPTGVSVLVLGTKLPSNSKFLKFFDTRETAFVFETPKGVELKRWIGKELQSHGLRNFPSQFVDTLVGLAEVSKDEQGQSSPLDFLAASIEKTALYLDSDTMTDEDLHYLYSEAVTVNEYELVETLISKRPGKAQYQLLKLVQQGKSPFLLLALLHRSFANYTSIGSGLKQGQSPSEIRRELGMTEWVFGKNISGAKAYSIRKLNKALREFVTADSKLKGLALESDSMLGAFLDRIAP